MEMTARVTWPILASGLWPFCETCKTFSSRENLGCGQRNSGTNWGLFLINTGDVR